MDLQFDENANVNSVLSKFPPGEHSWYEVKGNREIDLTLPDYNKSWQNDLSKALGALANSGGGYLVLGGVEEPGKIVLDGNGINSRIKNNGTKKWLEDILPTLTDPFLNKIEVFEFKNSGDSLLSNTALYIVEVKDSTIAPHQSKDNRYYVRIGTSSKPAPHQIVMDIMGRRRDPILEVDFGMEIIHSQNLILLNQVITNIGNVLANVVSGFIYLPKFLMLDYTEYGNRTQKIENIEYQLIAFSNINRLGDFPTPIPREMCFVNTYALKNEYRRNNRDCFNSIKLYWEIASDNGPLFKGQKIFNEIATSYKELP